MALNIEFASRKAPCANGRHTLLSRIPFALAILAYLFLIGFVILA